MEWSSLSPEDRRQLKALLHVDDDGFSREATTTLAPQQQVPAAAATGDSSITVTQSIILRETSKLIIEASSYWVDVKQLRQKYHRAGKIDVAQCKFQLINVIPCSVFDTFIVCWVRSTLPFSFVCKGQTHVDVLLFETMHFVHRDTGRSSGPVSDKGSFEVQSVRSLQSPTCLQCIGRSMLELMLIPWLVLTSPGPSNDDECGGGVKRGRSGSQERNGVSLWGPWGNVAVLGMGGNALGYTIAVTSPSTQLHVVDIEPSVYALCAMQGALPSTGAGQVSYHIISMEVFFAPPARHGTMPLDVIVLDCFDPHQATMAHGHDILSLCKAAMNTERSLLIVNMHALPSEDTLAVFYSVFGPNAVHAMKIAGCVQSLVLCVVSAKREVLEAIAGLTVPKWAQRAATIPRGLLAAIGGHARVASSYQLRVAGKPSSRIWIES